MASFSKCCARTMRSVRRVMRPVAEVPFRASVATGVAAMLSFNTAAHAEPIHVVECSLFEQLVADKTPVFRHVGLRIGPGDDFVEAHFGPGAGGDFTVGFLKTGKGEVADSTYLDVTAAGETSLSKEEALEWCREWAKDRRYVTVGQNCWHMVYTFLIEHEGCEVPESLKFKEEDINESTQLFIEGIDTLAEQEGVSSDVIIEKVRTEPRQVLAMIFKRGTLEKVLPESAVAKITNAEDKLAAAQVTLKSAEDILRNQQQQ